MSAEPTSSQAANATPAVVPKPVQPGAVVSSVIHRVCIQCNNMFRVTPDKFDAKQCPACHKG
jgi:hypothetical protein